MKHLSYCTQYDPLSVCPSAPSMSATLYVHWLNDVNAVRSAFSAIALLWVRRSHGAKGAIAALRYLHFMLWHHCGHCPMPIFSSAALFLEHDSEFRSKFLVPQTSIKHRRPIKPHSFDHVQRCKFLCTRFLPRDATQSAVMRLHVVCLSVRDVEV